MNNQLNRNHFCRVCEHAEIMHNDGLYGLKLYSSICCSTTDSYNNWCECLEYVPEDNLEYLEYLYDQAH